MVYNSPVWNHKLIVDVVFVFLRIFLVLLVVGPFERLARFLLLPLIVGINLVIEAFLKSKVYTRTFSFFAICLPESIFFFLIKHSLR